MRPKIFEALPTAGLPPQLADWDDFESYMATLGGAGVVRSIKDVWWDIRPHPTYGTVELRMCDAGSTLTSGPVARHTSRVLRQFASICG